MKHQTCTRLFLALSAFCFLLSAFGQTNVGLVATVTPGYEFSASERLTLQKLNLLGIPNVEISGTVSGGLLSTNSIGKAQLQTNVFDQVYLSGGADDSASIIDASIIGTKIATNSIGGTNITDATLTAADLSTNTLTAATLTTNAFSALSVVTPATNDLVLLMDASAASNTVAATVSSVFSNAFAPLFTSTNYTITSMSTFSVTNAAHGLGRVPYLVRPVWVCLSNDLSFVVGDEIVIESTDRDQDNRVQRHLYGANGTNCFYYMSNSGATPLDTANGELTANRWALKFYAW
jgi:hypothetical protein